MSTSTRPLLVADFTYDLPGDLIAQEPSATRDGSRLMVLDRASGRTSHELFPALPARLLPGDLLVVNDTTVIPARLLGRRASAGTGGKVEFLLVEGLDPVEGDDGVERQTWEALVKGARHEGETIEFGPDLSGRLIRIGDDGRCQVELSAPMIGGGVDGLIQQLGVMPVPPYIRREPDDPRGRADRQRYQTIFARNPGAIAAPTAGLHFTVQLLDAIRARGVAIESVTLHVGPGTFQPVRVEQVGDHRMLPERFVLSERTARAVRETKQRAGRVVAVGTTVCRTLESCAGAEPGSVIAGQGRADLFIYPGYRFRVVDALVTNFHLPRSTLLMLVAAFAGREAVLEAYTEAVRQRYRFFTYGDAMLVV